MFLGSNVVMFMPLGGGCSDTAIADHHDHVNPGKYYKFQKKKKYFEKCKIKLAPTNQFYITFFKIFCVFEICN